MKLFNISFRKQRRLLTVLFCLITISSPVTVQAQQEQDSVGKAYQQILESYPQNLADAQREGNLTYEAQILNNAGIAYQYFGEYQKALEFYQQALAIAKSISDREIMSQVLTQMGSTYSKLGDTQGIKFFEQLLKQARASGDTLMVSVILKPLGVAYMSLPNYPKAIAAYEEYLLIMRERKDRMEEAQILGFLISTYGSLGETKKQIDLLQQQLSIYQDIGSIPLQGPILSSLSSAYELLGDIPKAIAYQEQAIQIAQKSQDSSQEVFAWQQLALLYGRSGNNEKLISLLEKSVAIAQNPNLNTKFYLAIALDSLSRAYALVGNYPKAIDLQKQSLLIYQAFNQQAKIDTTLNEVWGLTNLGRQQFKAGQLSESENTLKAALTASSKLRESVLPISNLVPMSRDELNVNLREVTLDINRNLQQILVATNRTNEALELAEAGRARAFVDLLKTNLDVDYKSQPTTLPPTLEQMRQIAKEQNSTLVQYSIIYSDNVSTLVPLRNKRPDESILYIWVIQPTGNITFRLVNLPPLLQHLKNSEGGKSLLSLLVINARSSIFVRGRGVPVQDTQEMAPTSNPASPRRNYQQLQQLHQVLIQPIADLLPTDPRQRVTFIPHENLFLVPFAALQDANGKYLIEKHTILTAPSIQVLSLTHQQRKLGLSSTQNSQIKAKASLVVGNPTMPFIQPKIGVPPIQLPSLPGSEKEAKAIASLLNTQPLIGNQATENAVIRLMENAGIIHLATHGLLDNFIGFQSSLAFAPDDKDDGFLTAREIIQLKLKAELVVLSACDTGRGRISGDGVIGLSRSFIAAGVPSVIVSLWKVPDEPTADLMLSFYQNLQKTPDKAQALREAMLTTMARYPSPRDWSAFTLIGEAE